MEAFSITEMLITMVMGVAVLGVTAQLLASHTRVSTSSTELLQRRADWSKFSYLITTEAEESQELELGGTLPGTCGGGATALFTIKVATADDDGTDFEARDIYYHQVNAGGTTSVVRCGPRVLNTGALSTNTAAIDNETVLIGIPIVAATSTVCGRCLNVDTNFAAALDNSFLNPILLRPGFRAITK